MKNLKNKQARNFLLLMVLTISNFVIADAQQTVVKTGDFPTLKLNQVIERSIKGSETHSFQFNVKAGFYARAEVEQKNIDVVVSLFAPDGKLVVEMDGKDGRLWREAVSCIAENGGAYRVEIKAYGAADAAGNYTVKLVENRESTPNDRKRLEAEAHLSVGRKFYSQSKYQEAVKEYEAAARLWRELNEAEQEAVTLVNLGWANIGLSKNEQAIEAHTRAMELFQKTKDRNGESKAVNGLGNAYSDLNQNDKAREFYEKALILRREIGDKRGEGGTLLNLGKIYWVLSDYKKAIEYDEQALIITRQVKFRLNEGTLLNNLGAVYDSLAQYEKARDYYEQSLVISREIKDRNGEISTLNNLGIVYSNLTNYEKAKDYYEKALVINREIKNREGEGKTLDGLGNVHLNLKQYEKAQDYYEQSLYIRREIKDREGEGNMLFNLGAVYYESANYEKAKEYYERALIVRREIKDRSAEGNTLKGIGKIYYILVEYEKAKDYFEQTLIINRETKDRPGEAYTIKALGNIYFNLRQYRKAQLFYEQELAIRQEIKDRKGEGNTLNDLGDVNKHLSQYEKARNYYEQALAIAKETKDRNGESETLQSLGKFYDRLSQFVRTKDYYEQALVITKEIKDRRGEGNTLNGLGNAYFGLVQYEKAKDYYEQSLVVNREIKNREGEGNALSNLAFIYEKLNIYEKAQEYYEQSLLIARESKSLLLEGIVLNNLGNVYSNLKQYEKALQYYTQGLRIRQESDDREGIACSLWNLQHVSAELNNTITAIFYGKRAVNSYQEVRGNLKNFDRETQLSFLVDKEPAYRDLANLLISAGRIIEAQAVLNLLKDEEYDQLARSGEKGNTIPYSKSEADAVAKIDKLAALGREQNELRKQQKEVGDKFLPDKLKRLEEIAADIKTVNIEFDNSLAALSKAEASVKDQIADIQSEKNLQSALQNLGKELNTGAVALYTVIGTEEEKDASGKPLKDKTRSKFGWVILVTPKDRKAYPIDVTDLEQTVFQFREALSSDKYDPKPLAEKIYNAVFRQTSAKQKVTLEQDLQDILGKYPDKTIMWSLDGVLRYIPMAALHDGKGYLVEKYRNVVFTKESLLWLMNPPKAKPETLGLGVSAGNKDLNMSALPGVDKELADIIKQTNEKTGILNGTRKLNGNFKKQEILNLKDDDNSFQIVHIASHYSFNPTDQNASYLLIGDGKLTFGDMKTENNLFGTVDLLTLSACDTGVSGNGKEAEGFAFLAQSLGAKSVIASLWKVSDAGTPELMIRFYNLRKENLQMSKGEAFRQAQISLLGTETKDPQKTSADTKTNSKTSRSEIVDLSGEKIELPLYEKEAKKPLAHPHYWASFILIGNWR